MERRIKVQWSPILNGYIIKCRKVLFWKTACYPVDEFTEAPFIFDNTDEALEFARKYIVCGNKPEYQIIYR